MCRAAQYIFTVGDKVEHSIALAAHNNKDNFDKVFRYLRLEVNSQFNVGRVLAQALKMSRSMQLTEEELTLVLTRLSRESDYVDESHLPMLIARALANDRGLKLNQKQLSLLLDKVKNSPKGRYDQGGLILAIGRALTADHSLFELVLDSHESRCLECRRECYLF